MNCRLIGSLPGRYRPSMQRMHPKAVKLSRVVAFITHLIFAVIVILFFVLGSVYGWTMVPMVIASGVILLSGYSFIGPLPPIRANRFLFDIAEEEIRIHKGIWWIQDIVIPMVKVQHVELTSGPLMRKKELADVIIVTAATKHSIHGLEKEHAEAVQRRIAVWARVREDDV